MGCTSSNPASVKPIPAGFRPGTESDAGHKSRPIVHAEVPCDVATAETDIVSASMEPKSNAATSKTTDLSPPSEDKKSHQSNKSDTTDTGMMKTPDKSLQNRQQADSPSTVADSAVSLNSTPSTTGNQIIDPGMFITQQKGSLGERYHRDKKLGSGAYGEVWLCRDRQTNAERAIKFVKKSSVTVNAGTSLLEEVQVVKSLDHPNIMKLYEFFGDRKYYYLVMEVYRGGELFDEIINRQKFGEVDAAIIMKQVLSGVTYLHKHNIVHRDLKPENLLLESKAKDALIKIVDFGLSSHFEAAKKLKDRLGTAYYIAPEVLRKKYDEKCDVWSCGVILYILLCGYPPFGGASDQEILKRVEKGKFQFDPSEWSAISADAKDLIRQMLEYDPHKRISAETALQHPWIQRMAERKENGKGDAIMLAPALTNMKKFHATQRLARAALLYIGSMLLTAEETAGLKLIFNRLDKNGDGLLDRDELIAGYMQMLREKRDVDSDLTQEEIEREVDSILASVDYNQSGFIEYSEFVTVSMDRQKIATEERITKAFEMFDIDKSGKIAADELRFYLPDINDDQWQAVVKDVDTDGDGEVDLNEFKAMMMKFVRDV